MKTVRVSKSIMDKLSATGYAIGRKYAYSVRGRIAPRRLIVDRIPRYYYHDGINAGPRVCTIDYARRNGLLDIVEVKEKQQ